jgi:uncharacterized protein YkwD
MPELIRKPLRLAGILLTFMLTGCEIVERLPQVLPQVSPSPQASTAAAQSPATAQMEGQVQQQINQIRQQQGLTELRDNKKLAQVARDYSRRMAEQKFFAHVSPQGDTLADRVKAGGIFYLAVGENLFTSTNILQPVPAAVEGWMNSSGHRKNILRPEYRETGIGVWKIGNTYYFTQLFMRSLP